MKSLFIVNPRSGVRRRVDVPALIREYCASGEITTCGAKEDLDGIIREAAGRGIEVVYAVGGDGTVHEIAKRLVGTSLALGILPLGSGNGLARHLGIPLEAAEALRVCENGIVATIDTGTVNGMPFIGVMGVGLDALIAERFSSSVVRGLRTYVKLGLATFYDLGPEPYEIEVDGVRSSYQALLVAVANSSQYGNNARIAPLASLQDGILDVVVIEHVTTFVAPFMLMRLFNGSFHQSRHVKVLQGREITIRRASASAAHVDGEPISLPAELHVQVVPQSLRVVLPAGRTKI
ncbi:MAG TPA: YegS/Rv2252/BmrU family lipid kinase [Thermoanaerobaculia bacterium]